VWVKVETGRPRERQASSTKGELGARAERDQEAEMDE
jgi:hypothetical protein